jgi:hypothetical protein
MMVYVSCFYRYVSFYSGKRYKMLIIVLFSLLVEYIVLLNTFETVFVNLLRCPEIDSLPGGIDSWAP